METVGIRELRQDASSLVRRVEAGEEIEITVAGRLAARLVPLPTAPRQWNHWRDIADIFTTPVDAEWAAERELVDQGLVNPWEDDRS